jgi:quaternary ammonium compound-resistance protein SugE
MAWTILIVAGLLETAWAIALKESHGFKHIWWGIAFIVTAVASLVLLSIALRSLPVGSAYAVWTGIGAVGTAIVGMLFLDEPRDVIRILAVMLIISGVALLRFAGAE